MKEPSVRIWKPRTRQGPLPGEPVIKESWTWFWTLVAVGILAPPLVAFCVTAAVSAGSPPVPAPVEVVMEAPPEDQPETPEPAPRVPGQSERVPGDVLSDLETAFVEGTGSVLVRLSTSDEEALFDWVRGEGQMPWLEGFTIVRLGARSETEQTLQLTGRGPRVVVRLERSAGLWRVVSIRPVAPDKASKPASSGNG
jgi:hypothetical protein